jgi:hypothetical protein
MRKKAFVGLMVGFGLVIFSSMAMASDTSPYLIGAWEDNWSSLLCESTTIVGPPSGGNSRLPGPGCIWTDFIIVNPTPTPVLIFAAFFENDGTYIGCTRNTINANAKWYIQGGILENLVGLGGENNYMGTAKFFAFPVPTPPATVPRTYNASMVIGGFQVKYFSLLSRTESNLNGVAINSITSWEFNNILKLQQSVDTACIPYKEPQALASPR